MTSYVTIFQLNSTHEVESIQHLFGVAPNCNFSERWISIVSSRDPARDFFCLRWAFSPINLVELLVLGWPFIILKAPNPTNQPACSEKNLATFKSSMLKAPT